MSIAHPVTGIELNALEVERIHLSYADAVTAHVMKMQGEKFSSIAHKLGANPARIGEVFRGEKYPEAINAAKMLIATSSSKGG